MNPDTRRLIGITLFFAPIIFLIIANQFIILIFHLIFKEISLEVSSHSIVHITLTYASISNIITDVAAESLTITQKKTHEKPLFLSIDATNKDGIHHVVKEITYWDHNEDRLFIFTLDYNIKVINIFLNNRL